MRASITKETDGRTRRKLAAMARIQGVALTLIERRGYDRVTIEEIAQAAEVGPATIYRNFGSKERIVLWDAYDPLLLQAITRELAGCDVLDAVKRALSVSLAQIYRTDGQRILRRARLVRKTPALQHAVESDQLRLRAALAEVLLAARCARDALQAQVFAGAITAAMLAGLDLWLDGNGRRALSRCFGMAFRRLAQLVPSR